MKNTIRIHKNTATKSASVQSKSHRNAKRFYINPGAEFELPPDATHAACIAIFNRENGAMFKVPLSEKEFGDAWRQSIKPGALPLHQFIAVSVRDRLAHTEKWKAQQNFETAARKALSLLDLLFSKLVANDPDCLNASLPDYNAEKTEIICGIQELLFEVKVDLTAGLCGRSTTEEVKELAL